MDVDGVFTALVRMGEQRHAEWEARQESLRIARNERARARYAIRKKLGTLPTKKKTEALAYDLEPESVALGCYCHTVTMPPCSWCEDGWIEEK
jgi:DNA replication protein DnaC